MLTWNTCRPKVYLREFGDQGGKCVVLEWGYNLHELKKNQIRVINQPMLHM